MPNITDFGYVAPLTRRQTTQQANYQDQQHQLALSQQNSQVAAPTTNYTNQFTGQAPQGGIQQAAYKRLTTYDKLTNPNPLTAQQAMNQLNGPQYQQNVQQSFNQVGTNSGSVTNSNAYNRLQNRINEGYAQIDARNKANEANGTQLSPEALAQQKAAYAQQVYAEEQAAQQQQQQAQTKATESANASANASAQQNDQNGQVSGSMAALANLPPEAQALAPYFQNVLSSIQQGQIDQANATQAMLNGGTINGTPVMGIHPTFNAIDAKLKDMESSYTAMQQGIQGMLDKAKDAQDKYLNEQEQAQKDRLAWDEQQQLRQAAKEKQAAVDSKVAFLALRGRIGSDGAQREVEETRNVYEQRMSDLKIEFGVQRTELAAKFSGLHLEAMNDYTTKTISNIKDTASALERINSQSMASLQARSSAEQSILGKFMDSQVSARKELANANLGIAKEIQTTINAARDDKRAQEQLGWQRLQWVAQTYGSNAPQALLDSIGKQLPGVDVRSVASQMTLAEMKKKGGGGGIGGFSSSMIQGTGQPISYESFVQMKKKELMADTTKNSNDIKAALDPKALKKEYEARKYSFNQKMPTNIMDTFEIRAAAQNLSGPVYNRTKALLNGLITAGETQTALSIVNNIGDDINSTDSQSFERALTSRRQVLQLHEAMQNIGQYGPMTGRVKNLNPYNAETVRVKNLITQTVPGLARGIFYEVGVLTDQDVARYTATLENPNLTLQEAQNAYNDLMTTIDSNIELKLKVWESQNKRTAGLRSIYQEEIMDDPDEAYANSILNP